MTGRKTQTASGTAVAVTSSGPVIINAKCDHDPCNPHTWLPLLGDPPGTVGLRVMWGVLRASYGGHDNSASAFVAAKTRVSWSADPSSVTAAWVETLAPSNVDDSFADAKLLAARIDHEIGRDAEGKTPLLGYATITDAMACRLHVFREEVRGVARELVDAYARPPLKRSERANTRREVILSRYGDKKRDFLDFVLAQYAVVGGSELDDSELPALLELKYGTPIDAVREIGSVAEIRSAFLGFQRDLY